MIGVVLGNGPSKTAYDRTGDFVIGCNIPDSVNSVDATVICDVEIVWILKNSPNLIGATPLIISTNVYEKMKEFRIVDDYVILHVFKPRDWYNSAHYAAQYLIDNGCEEIHIWGCDSIFEDTIKSSTDELVKKDMDQERFIRHWRQVWVDIHKSHPYVNFVAFRYNNN
jgi:hypothetical protein